MSNIEFYESIDLLPIRKYQKFNKFLMISNEVGEDLSDYDRRTQRAISYLRQNDTKNAIKELTNRRQMVFNALQEYSPQNMALAVMVKSIDGIECTSIDENSLNNVLDRLNELGFSKKQIKEKVISLKKKLSHNLRHFLGWLKRTTIIILH